MVTLINTITVQALKAIQTEIQISIYNGIPSFSIVGMVNKSVNEAAIRIRTAINSLGFDIPAKKIVVNLSPTNIIKEGNYYDLPIAVGILSELNIIQNIDLKKFLIIGELSLDGRIKSVNVALLASMYAKLKNLSLICPKENGEIAALSSLKEIIPSSSLIELITHLNNKDIDTIIPPPNPPIIRIKTDYENDFSMIRGQEDLKRAFEIFAAGGHSILIQGPPGIGKTFAAECVRSILPDLSVKEIIEILLIKNSGQKDLNSQFSSQKNLEDDSVIHIERPFRNPHHSASVASIVGGGKMIEPGEITLAHNGVLFLDELPEFSPNVLDSLREPLEKKEINLTRAERNVIYPANFQLIAALNPCKCGYFGVKGKECGRAPTCALNYQKKISGPLLDRIDLFVYLQGNDLNSKKNLDKSYVKIEEIKEKINFARKKQEKRFAELDFQTNSSAKSSKDFIDLCKINKESINFLKNLLESEKINQRVFIKTISIARTIADLENEEFVNKDHVLEALYFKKTCI